MKSESRRILLEIMREQIVDDDDDDHDGRTSR